MRAIGPNSFPEEDNELLHTPLFKQVSPEQANELIPYRTRPYSTRATISSARATGTTACICWSAAASS